MTSRCFLSLIAGQDINEIITYRAQQNPVVASTFLNSLFTARDNLTEFPKLKHLRVYLTDKPVKFWMFKWHYLITYKPTFPITIVSDLRGIETLLI